MRILIIGGGIIGLSIAWQLARRNLDVHLFEARRAGRQASWAAAGLLCPYTEALFEDEALLALSQTSLALYPQFLTDLAQDTRSPPLAFDTKGTLFVGITRDDRAFLEHLYQEQRTFPVEWVSGQRAREIEPLLSPRVSCGVWFPQEAQIDNRALLQTLLFAFQQCGGLLHEECPIQGVWEEGGHLLGIRTHSNEYISGDLAIDTTGAWSDSLRVRPQKGQIATVQMPKELPLSHVIRTPRVYLAPKRSSLLRIGATSEEKGFDRTVTAGAILELLQAAIEVVPGIDQMELIETTAELRPMSDDRLPLIEKTSLDNYFRAVGHGRSGCLLAPYTASAMSALLFGENINYGMPSEWEKNRMGRISCPR